MSEAVKTSSTPSTPPPAPAPPAPPGGGMVFSHYIQIGCGGTGTWLAEALVRWFRFHKTAWPSLKKLVFIDGDFFEAKNQERQLFSKDFIGQSKPDAMKKRLDFLAPEEMEEKLITIGDYINGTKFLSMLAGLEILEAEKPEEINPLVILAVDNDATRKEILDTLVEADIKNFVVISPGNEWDNGRCSIEWRKNGEKKTMTLQDRYENIRKPSDEVPKGCANSTPSAPQLIFANYFAAGVTALTIRNMVEGYAWYDEVIFEATDFKIQPSGRSADGKIDTPIMGKSKKEIVRAERAKKKAEDEAKKAAAIAAAQNQTTPTPSAAPVGAAS